MTLPDTHTRLLEAAEALFAEKGFAATSLRAVTAAAEANLAAVHYHFGSKEGLFTAVFARRVEPLNRERLALLDRAETEAAPAPPPVETILEAFLRPLFQMAGASEEAGRFVRSMSSRFYTEPGSHWNPVIHSFDEVKERFFTALKRALPGLRDEEIFWRIHFMIGVMCHTLADTERLTLISEGLCDPSDTEDVLNRLIGFTAAGMRTPAGKPPRRKIARK